MSDIEETPKGGRPLKFQSVEELDSAIGQYFHSRDPHIIKTKTKVTKADGSFYWVDDEILTEAKPKTMTGLARALKVHRTTLINYKDRPEFFDSIDRALAECEEYAEEQLFIGRSQGAAFVLKNNYGWSDSKEVNNTHRSVAEIIDELDRQVELANGRDNVAEEAGKELERLEQERLQTTE